eukprot:scaffold21415_cov57-Cyclotella_meneghiniana.AAC.4
MPLLKEKYLSLIDDYDSTLFARGVKEEMKKKYKSAQTEITGPKCCGGGIKAASRQQYGGTQTEEPLSNFVRFNFGV